MWCLYCECKEALILRGVSSYEMLYYVQQIVYSGCGLFMVHFCVDHREIYRELNFCKGKFQLKPSKDIDCVETC